VKSPFSQRSLFGFIAAVPCSSSSKAEFLS
jgi:hypothetical protein